MRPVRTKWHKLVELSQGDDVYMTAPPGGLSKSWEEFYPDKNNARAFIGQLSALPKFVIDEELVKLAGDENHQQSLLDMRRCGVLRLPYPAMIVEMPMMSKHFASQSQAMVLLRDVHDKQIFPWEDQATLDDLLPDSLCYAYCMRVHWDKDGYYLVLSPTVLTLGITKGPTGDSGRLHVRSQTDPVVFFRQTKKLEELIGATFTKDTGVAYYALFAATVLMSTRGVDKEVVEVERLNKRRVSSGKPSIPRHTYLHIGRVYRSADSEQSEAYVPRKSPIPHFRRGHAKHVHYGVGREKLKLVWIPAKLVACVDDLTTPRTPEYVVTP